MGSFRQLNETSYIYEHVCECIRDSPRREVGKHGEL
jgi:hypothetical protein